MNSMNDERFFDLAMKVTAQQASDAERAELDALLRSQPQLKVELERFQADVQMAKNALPLVEATQATAGKLPSYVRGRLQTKVRQTLGGPAAKKETDRSLIWGWRWALGLATAVAVVFLVAVPMMRTPTGLLIQVAVLDTTGGTRGTVTNDTAVLQGMWRGSPVQTFSSIIELEAWEKNLATDVRQPIARIIYDPAAGEVRVSGQSKGKPFQENFPLEKDLITTLQRVKAFVLERGF